MRVHVCLSFVGLRGMCGDGCVPRTVLCCIVAANNRLIWRGYETFVVWINKGRSNYTASEICGMLKLKANDLIRVNS